MRFLILPMLIAAVYAGAQIDAYPPSASLTFQPFTVGGDGTKAFDSFDPSNYIIDTGRGHQEIAAAPVSVSAESAERFIASGLNNVLSYTPGISINDGSAHTIGTAPNGTVFHGITTLSGIATISINGTTPFSWITGQRTPFMFSASSYNLTDAKAASIDIGWLAIQTALLSGRTYVPSGKYIIGSVIPLPLYVPAGSDTGGVLHGTYSAIYGDGPRLSRIVAGYDWGSAYSLIICGDPSGTVTNSLGRYSINSFFNNFSGDLESIGFFSSAEDQIFSIGTVGIHMDGLGWGARLRLKDVESSGFNHNVTFVGDHTKAIRLHSVGGAIGLYFPAPSTTNFGDVQFDDLRIEGQSRYAIGVSATANIAGNFEGETYLSAPYAIFGEPSSTCTAITSDVQFDSLHAEYLGNALITDDTGYLAGTYRDTNKCRNVSNLAIRELYVSYKNSNFWGGSGSRQRRAAIDVAEMSARIDQIDCDSGCWAPSSVPTPPGSDPAVATLLIRNPEDGVGDIVLSGNVDGWIAKSGSTPLLVLMGSGYNQVNYLFKIHGIGWDGYLMTCFGSAGNHKVFSRGDVVEANGSNCGVGGSTLFQMPFGIAMKSGPASTKNMTVGIPVAVSGQVEASTGWLPYSDGPYKKSTGVGKQVMITAKGMGGTDGAFSWTATGGGCKKEPTGDFTVSGGAIIATTIVTHGTQCTGVPSISTSASSGLVNAKLTPTWPSGLVTSADSFADGPIVGSAQGGKTLGGGANTINLHIQGLQ